MVLKKVKDLKPSESEKIVDNDPILKIVAIFSFEDLGD